jgi:tryptophanase
MSIRTIIEPFRIKSVEAIRTTTRTERQKLILDVWRRRDKIPGYKLVHQAPFLRHFTARLQPASR